MSELYLDGTLTNWVTGTLQYDAAIGERSVLSFAVVDVNETLNVQKGQQVYFYSPNENGNETLQFAGFVETFTETALTSVNDTGLIYSIGCVDWNTYLDRRIASGSFENTTSGEIVNDLVWDFLDDDNIYTHPYPGTAVTLARDQMVAYWRLNNSANDSGWRQHDGTELGDPTYTAEDARVNADFVVAGSSPVGDTETGGHGDFDGVGDGIDTGIASSKLKSYYDINGELTISMWLWKQNADFNFNYAMFLGDDSILSNKDYTLSVRYDGNTSTQSIAIRVLLDTNTELIVDASGGNITLENWDHLLFTIKDNGDGTTTLTAWWNGVQTNTASASGAVDWAQTGTSNLRIGTDEDNTNEWAGRIAEVLIASREFSQAEIELLDAQADESNRTATGTSITKFTANYQDVGGAIESMAEITTYENFVDQYRTLHFHPRGAACCTAPFTIDNNILQARGVVRENKSSKYRNRQIIKGGQDETATQTEVIEAYANQEAFTLGFKVARAPTSIELDNTAQNGTAYVSKTFSIKGNTGSDFYYERGSEVIVADSGTTINAGDLLRVTYKGEFDVVIIASDQAEITSRRTTEKAGTGIVDAVLVDRNVESRTQGFEIAGGKLDTYAVTGNIFKFTTRNAGLRPGQQVTLNVPRHGFVSETGIVETISLFDEAGIELRYNVEVATGAVLKSWQAFFSQSIKEAAKAGDRENLNEAEITTIVIDENEEPAMAETTSITVSETPVPVTCTILSDPGPTLGFVLC